jgi:predicted peptidase
VIAAPQLRHPGGNVWGQQNHPSNVQSILRELRVTYEIDPHRLYLTGFSYGGNGVLEIGAQQSGTWAALWPVDPSHPHPDAGQARRVWLWYGERFEKENDQTRDSLQQHLGQPALPNGPGADRCFTFLTDRELDPEDMRETKNNSHVSTARMAYRSDAPYQWLLGQRL